MRLKNNEDGSTLLMVILLVAVIAILGTALFAMNASATKQFSNKEEQVQARHLAEMGIEHYQAIVEKNVQQFNEEFEPVISVDNKGNSYFDKIATDTKYIEGLCSIVKLDTIIKTDLETGIYEVEIDDEADDETDLEAKDSIICSIDKPIIVPIKSTGETVNATQEIKAMMRISSNQIKDDNEPGQDHSNETNTYGYLPQKPAYPAENWVSKKHVANLDSISNSEPAKVLYAITNQDPFETTAFVGVDGAVSMNKKSTWTFYNHFLVEGSMTMHTAGKNLSTLTVKKDFFIGGAFDSNNHNEVIIGGDLIINGAVSLGNGLVMNIDGNALFDYQTSDDKKRLNTWPQTSVIIKQNAYFKSPASSKAKENTVCVRGDIFLWKSGSWQSYLPEDDGYKVFKKECGGTSPPLSSDDYQWQVDESVSAEYVR